LRISLDLLADATRPAVRASGEVLWQAPLIAVSAQAAIAFEIP
jgi:hypothetical protein